MKTEMPRRETLLHEMFKAQAFEAPKRKPWSVSRHIVCQADMEEAQEILRLMEFTFDAAPENSALRKHMAERIAKVKALIAHREENSI